MQFNYGFEDFEAKGGEYKPTVLKEGNCTFTILEIVNTTRDGAPLVAKSSGLPMVKIKFDVTDSKGATTKIYEYLTSKASWKIKTLLDAIGKSDLYNSSGQLNLGELLGLTGACTVETDSSYDPEKPRSVIKKYLKAKTPAVLTGEFKVEDFDDVIPF